MACSVLAWGCHSSPWAHVAERASLPELQQTVQQRLLRGPLEVAEVRELAQSVARREIESAVDPDGEQLLGAMRGCGPAVTDALSKRSQRSDHTAGVALLTLVESGKVLSSAEWFESASSTVAARRAAAALASRAPERWLVREQLLNDADLQVRRAALQSTYEAPARLHLGALIEVLRHDPESSCRELAARSIGVLGGSEADTILSDAFNTADPQLKIAIVSGWAQAESFRNGGEGLLVAVARAEAGIVGALAGADLARGTSSSRSIGQARVARSLEFGAAEDLQVAIAAADWDDRGHAAALIRLGMKADPPLRVQALGRWLETRQHKWPAITWLRQLAEGDEGAAIVARSLLAQQGEGSVIGALRRQLTYANWQSRAQAARDLWRLRDLAGISRALSDDAPEVRVAAACSVLTEATAERPSR